MISDREICCAYILGLSGGTVEVNSRGALDIIVGVHDLGAIELNEVPSISIIYCQELFIR